MPFQEENNMEKAEWVLTYIHTYIQECEFLYYFCLFGGENNMEKAEWVKNDIFPYFSNENLNFNWGT